MEEWTSNETPPDFDQALADSYVGKYILIGVTYIDPFGHEVERVQLHGVVASANTDGIRITLRGKHAGEEWVMPPDLSSVSAANPGNYSLRNTGEVVENPDLIATWQVTKPSRH